MKRGKSLLRAGETNFRQTGTINSDLDVLYDNERDDRDGDQEATIQQSR
jgi:hypothetical protein